MKDIQELAERCLKDDPRTESMRRWAEEQSKDACMGARFYYRFLFAYAKRYAPKVMVELGTDYGYGAWHMAQGNPEGKVVAVDLNFDHFVPTDRNISKIRGDTVESARVVKLLVAQAPIDLIFVDSDHTPEHAMREFNTYDPLCASGALQLFDDVNFPGEMQAFWKELPGSKLLLNDLHPKWGTDPAPGFGIRVKP